MYLQAANSSAQTSSFAHASKIKFRKSGLRTRIVKLRKPYPYVTFGIHVEHNDATGHVISHIIPNSPASFASDLHINDVIVQIGDEVILHLPYEVVREKLRTYASESVILYVAAQCELIETSRTGLPILTNFAPKPTMIQRMNGAASTDFNAKKNCRMQVSHSHATQHANGSSAFMNGGMSRKWVAIKDDTCNFSFKKINERNGESKISTGPCTSTTNQLTIIKEENDGKYFDDTTFAETSPIKSKTKKQHSSIKQKQFVSTFQTKIYNRSSSNSESSADPAKHEVKQLLQVRSENSSSNAITNKKDVDGSENQLNRMGNSSSRSGSGSKSCYIKEKIGFEAEFNTTPYANSTQSSEYINQVTVTNLTLSSVAQVGGLQVNDIIIGLNGVDVERMTIDDFNEAFKAAFQKNREIIVSILRSINDTVVGQQITIREQLRHEETEDQPSQKSDFTMPSVTASTNIEKDKKEEEAHDSLDESASEIVAGAPNEPMQRDQEKEDNIYQQKNGKKIEKLDDDDDDDVRTIEINDARNNLLGFDLKTITLENPRQEIGGVTVMHALGRVVDGLPGQKSGMKDGDRIVSINDHPVDNLSHSMVLSLIKQNIDHIVLTVKTDHVVRNAILADEVNKNVVDNYRHSDPTDTSSLKPLLSSESGTYNVTLYQNPVTKSIGISLTADLSIYSIDWDSDAKTLGLKSGDILMEINGTPISAHDPMEAFNTLEKAVKCGPVNLKFMRNPSLTRNKIVLPMSSRREGQVGAWTDASIKLPMMFPETSVHKSVTRFCTINVVDKKAPLGLSLNESIGLPHKLVDIQSNSPAGNSGLKCNDFVISVNGRDVRKESFDEVKFLIKEGQANGRIDFEVCEPALYREKKDEAAVGRRKQYLSGKSSEVMSRRDGRFSSFRAHGKPPLVFSHDKEENVQVVLQQKQPYLRRYVIESIVPDSKAMRVGLRKNDCITSVNGLLLSSYDLQKANDFVNCALDSNFSEIVIESEANGVSGAVCLIRNGTSSWKVKDSDGSDHMLKSARYISEPDIRANAAGRQNGFKQISNPYNKIMSSIKRFCSKDRSSKRPSIVGKSWLKPMSDYSCMNQAKSKVITKTESNRIGSKKTSCDFIN